MKSEETTQINKAVPLADRNLLSLSLIAGQA
jgi:hypothetical protein